MTKRAALYIRVSTETQTVENQRLILEQYAQDKGWQVVKVYDDSGFMGDDANRPAYNQMVKDIAASRKPIDVVIAWHVDRLGRSLQELIAFLDRLTHRQIELVIHQNNLDTTTPEGRAMFGMLAIFAEFEKSMIKRRVTAGLNRAKAQGKQLGRRPVEEEMENQIRLMREQGLSFGQIRNQVTYIDKHGKRRNVGYATISRIDKAVQV